MATLDEIRRRIAASLAMTIAYKRPYRPERFCNGGPNGHSWCGLPGEFICTDQFGLQWFACQYHTEGARTERTNDWFARHFDRAMYEDINLPR